MPEKALKNIREEFIKKFVSSLIINSYKPEKTYIHEIDTHKQNELFTPSEFTLEKIARPLKPKVAHFPQKQLQQNQPMLKQKSPAQLPPVQPSQPLKPGEKPDSINLGRLAKILLDPAVLSIECGGPGRTLTINRSGQIQNSNIMLNKEDIDNVMNNFSDKTRIPLVPGVFRAAFKDLLITAVISEFVGTRFLIEKRYDYQLSQQ